MDKQRDLTKNLSAIYDHNAIRTRLTGVGTSSGLSTHKILCTDPPRASPLSNVSWDINHLSSLGPENPQTYLPSITGCNVAKRFGMRLMCICRGQ